MLRYKKPMSFDDLLLELQDQKTNQKDPNHTSLDDLFNEAFMSKYTSFKSFDQFMENGNFEVKTLEDIINYPEELFDRYVVRETNFSDWESMKNKATEEYEGHS